MEKKDILKQKNAMSSESRALQLHLPTATKMCRPALSWASRAGVAACGGVGN